MDATVNSDDAFDQEPEIDSTQYDAARELLNEVRSCPAHEYNSEIATNKIAAANVHALLALRDAIVEQL